MNSRERILTTINHKEPDRVPIDLGSTPSSGISAIAYNNLKKHLSINTGHTRVYDVVQQVAQPEMNMLDKFKIDAVDIGRTFNTNDNNWYDVTLSDGSKAQYPLWFKPELQSDGSYIAFNNEGQRIGKMPKGATFFDQTVFPYIDGYPDNFSTLPQEMNKVVWSALPLSPWDHANEKNFWADLRKKAIFLKKNSDRAIILGCGCNLFEWGTFLRRMDNFLVDIYLEPKLVESFLESLMEIHLSTLEKACSSVGDIVDIIKFGDDLGTDRGPFMSPEIYRKIFKPRHKILCDYVKKNSNAKTFLHSCGSIYKLMPDLIEVGYDVINPVQTSCVGMDPVNLKKEFGKDITFWGGGCDTRTVLNKGTVSQVKEHVKQMLDIFSKDGGYVFNTVHNIMPDVPPENIVAMYEAIDEFNCF